MSTIADLMENKQVLAAGWHSSIGLACIWIPMLFGHSFAPYLWIEPILVLFVLLKEFWWDLTYEAGEDLTSSAQDAIGYVAGNAVGLALLGLAVWRGTWSVQ